MFLWSGLKGTIKNIIDIVVVTLSGFIACGSEIRTNCFKFKSFELDDSIPSQSFSLSYQRFWNFNTKKSYFKVTQKNKNWNKRISNLPAPAEKQQHQQQKKKKKKLNLTFSITTIYRNIKKRQPRKRQKKKQGTRETSVTWIIQSRALRRAKAKFLFSNVFFLSFRRFSFIIDAGLHFLSPTKRSNRREEKTTFTQGFFYSKSKLRYESFAFFMCQCALLSEKAGREERRQKGKLKERKKFYIFRVSRLFARFLYQ